MTNRKNKFLSFAIILLCFQCIAETKPSETKNLESRNILNPQELIFADIESRGQTLRKELDQAYLTSKSTKPFSIEESKIFKSIVARYVKPGDSFDYAETLLRSARMGVDTDPTHVPPRENVRLGFVVAKMKFESFLLGGYTSLGIALYPKNDNDFSSIGKVDVIHYSFP